MEAWFGNFAYALLDENTDSIQIVERTQSNTELDKYLRCFGGDGKYDGKRIGRVLMDMTFGGMGIVDHPANPRSGGIVHASEDNNDLEINLMPEEIRDAVKAELDALNHKKEFEKALAQVDELTQQNAIAAENLERMAEKINRAEEAKNAADAILAALGKKLDSVIGDDADAESVEAKLDIVLAKSSEAKATDEEILKELEELRAFKDEAEAAKAEAEKAALIETRKAEVKELLGEDIEEEILESVIAKIADLDDEAYATRLDEWKLIAAQARPTVKHDGGEGSPDEEGATGERKAKSGPREDHKVSASLESAEVEEHLEPKEEVTEPKDLGLAKLLSKRSK